MARYEADSFFDEDLLIVPEVALGILGKKRLRFRRTLVRLFPST